MSIMQISHYTQATGIQMSTESNAAILEPVEVTATSASKTHPSRVGVIAAFFAIYVIWGSTYLAIRYAVDAIPPLYTAGPRHPTARTLPPLCALPTRQRPT